MGRLLIPLLAAAVTGGIFLLFAVTSSGDQRTLMLAAAVAMVLVAAIPTVWSFYEDRRTYARETRKQRADYHARLIAARERLEALREEERVLRLDLDPSPTVLRQRAEDASPRLWERRPTDEDFLRLRIGLGTDAAHVKIASDIRPSDLEWDLGRDAASLANEFRTIDGVPILADLKNGAMGVAGAARDQLARALLCHAAVQHSPDELWIAAFVTQQHIAGWSWLKWLPHLRSRRASEPGRALLAWDPFAHQTQSRWLLEELTSRQRAADEHQGGRGRFDAPWLLIFVEDAALLQVEPAFQLALSNGSPLRVAVLVAADHATQLPDRCRSVVSLSEDGQTLTHATTEARSAAAHAAPDPLDQDAAEAIARALAPLVPTRPTGQAESEIPTRVSFLEAVGAGSVHDLDMDAEWTNRDTRQWLRFPLGMLAGGKLLELDLKEQALGGQGPHGLIAGTTGAGKSELLLTMIAGLALRHPPDVVNFVLVDYKGGDAFRSVADLPHTVALITDLDKHLASRALIALKAELKRRERRMGDLKDAGVASVAEYQRVRGGAPMPFLVIVVDEFARLKDELPEFIHGLIDVARVGRSLGVHLILATQTPSGTVDDEIQKNVNFGISLRVRDAYDSRSVIGEADAALLPGSIPGRAYLRVGLDPIQLFQTARVGGRYTAQDEDGAIAITAFAPEPGRPTLVHAGVAVADSEAATSRQTEVEVLAEHIRHAALQRGIAATAWPGPLPEEVSLFDGLEREAERDESAGPWHWPTAPEPDWLIAPVGLADEPASQRQNPLQLDVAHNVLVIGAAASGKSTLLRTLATSLAMSHAPEDLHLYGLDFGAHGLRGLASLPHCGADGVFYATEADRVRRLFRLLMRELDRRRAAGVSNLRQQRRSSADASAFPFLMVLLDNYPAFREVFDDGGRSYVIDDTVGDLIALMRDGPAVGISFVVTSPQQAGITSGVFNAAEVRVALRQNEPGDYVFVGRMENAPERVPPGRAFTTGTPPVEFQVYIAEPNHVAERMRAARPAFAPLRVEELPTFLSMDDPRLRDERPSSGMRMLLGLEDEGKGALWIDLEADAQHLIVAGPSGAGKTTLLATMLLSSLGTPVRWYLAASRRSALLELAACEQCAGAANGMAQLEEMTTTLDSLIDERREALHATDGSSATSGNPIIVVVDDYDLLRQDDEYGQAGSALAKIARRGGAVGVHVLTACSNVELRGSYDDLVRYLTQVRAGILLQPDLELDGDLFSIRLRRTGESAPPTGRGHLIVRQSQRIFQAATPQTERGSLADGIRAYLSAGTTRAV